MGIPGWRPTITRPLRATAPSRGTARRLPSTGTAPGSGSMPSWAAPSMASGASTLSATRRSNASWARGATGSRSPNRLSPTSRRSSLRDWEMTRQSAEGTRLTCALPPIESTNRAEFDCRVAACWRSNMLRRLASALLVALLMAVPVRAIAQEATPVPNAGVDLLTDLGLPEFAVPLTDTDSTVPAEAPAGRLLVRVDNQRDAPSNTGFVQFPPGTTAEQALKDMQSNLEEGPDWFYESVFAGGTIGTPSSEAS